MGMVVGSAPGAHHHSANSSAVLNASSAKNRVLRYTRTNHNHHGRLPDSGIRSSKALLRSRRAAPRSKYSPVCEACEPDSLIRGSDCLTECGCSFSDSELLLLPCVRIKVLRLARLKSGAEICTLEGPAEEGFGKRDSPRVRGSESEEGRTATCPQCVAFALNLLEVNEYTSPTFPYLCYYTQSSHQVSERFAQAFAALILDQTALHPQDSF
ncbi:hypothetical protein BDV98DRAFT_206977 [Pterulicium gracile]|uniref:Uncharacterized protein n=1 Tax=Pterulicium gracile TaxID=1884261 RepID=A0A5C3Q959_9AGAR|nr:hypothetical protein BDV98DRAFT_206977 [Pterula gracilis]